MKTLLTCITILIGSLSLAASSLLIDDFDGYADTFELQLNWGSFGVAATAGPPVLHPGEGVDGSNAARFALDWRQGNNNANARRINVNADLSGYDAVSVVAYITTRETFDEPDNPTIFKVAIQGANGDIWQTPTPLAPTVENTDYQTFVFPLSDLILVVVGAGGTLNDTLSNVDQIRLRLENPLPTDNNSRQDIFFDRVEAVILEGGGGEGVEIPNLKITQAVEIHFDTIAGQTYQIQSSKDLDSWENEGDLISGSGQEVSRLFSVRQDPPKAFFRVLTTTP